MRRVSEVYFYHLTRQRVDQALRPLLSKCLANGWRVVIRGREAAEIQQLDDALWQGPAEEFLPMVLPAQLRRPISLYCWRSRVMRRRMIV